MHQNKAPDVICYNAVIQSLFIRVKFTEVRQIHQMETRLESCYIFLLSPLNPEASSNTFGEKKLCLTADLDIRIDLSFREWP